MPLGIVATRVVGKIENQEIHVETDRGHRGVGCLHDFPLSPAVSVVIQRIVDRDQRPQDFLQRSLLLFVEIREVNLAPFRRVGNDAGLAAGATHRRNAVTVERTVNVQQFQGFEKNRDRMRLAEAVAVQEFPRDRVCADQRRGMGLRRTLCLSGATDLVNHDRLVQCPRFPRQLLETGDRIEALDVEAEGRHVRVVEQRQREIGHADDRLVADGHDVGQRQAALLHGEIDRDIGRLRNYCDAGTTLGETAAAMLIRP